jgi:kynurenine formamidase
VDLPDTPDVSYAWTPPSYEVDRDGKVVGAQPPAVHNWGRWGERDQRGTTNLISDGAVVEAAALVRSGRVFSLAIPIDGDGPVHPSRPRAMRLNTLTGADFVVGSPQANGLVPGQQWTDDVIVMAVQGSTQWDGLAHFMRDGVMYNGWWGGVVTAAGGAARNGMEHQRETLVGRGVLLDVCRHRGGEPMSAGDAIGPDELDAVARAQGTQVRSGDMVLVRTGYLGVWYTLGSSEAARSEWLSVQPGLSPSCVQWCSDRDVAAVAMDNWSIDVIPAQDPAGEVSPFHQAAIPGLGLSCGELFWLDDLARACAEEGRHEFFLSAQPLYLPHASGSMLNPIAVL